MIMSQCHDQLQNPATQQTGSETVDDVKPFSIRQYVLASRHRSIFHSWPFHDKYLQMCLNHGIRDVLPPFGCQTSQSDDRKEADQFCKTEVQQQHYDIDQQPQNITKNECDLSHEEEEGNQDNIINCGGASVINYVSESADRVFTLPIPTSSIHDHKGCKSMAPSKTVLKEKCRRRRGRCKKRPMVDILAVARHCTLEFRGDL